jgi:xanthine dehydrogenase molybdopterin-binding subunit B
VNNFVPDGNPEEVFCSGVIGYAGQPIGLIVADTAQNARSGARKLRILFLSQWHEQLIEAFKGVK